MSRSGIGYDSHRLAAGRRLVLGGVEIPNAQGLQGHSDADVLTHAVIDALRDAGQADQLQLQRLKKRKLLLRDKLVRLEDQLTPDIIA